MTARRWIVFDLDDTLVDTFGVGWRKFQAVADRLGLAAPDEGVYASHYGRSSYAECAHDWDASATAGFHPVALITAAGLQRDIKVRPRLIVDRADRIAACLAPLTDPVPAADASVPKAISVDAGFTLINHRHEPAAVALKVLHRHGRRGAFETLAKRVDLAEPLAPTPGDWSHDDTAHRALLAFYGFVLAPFTANVEALAAEVVAEYTAPANWFAITGADIRLRDLQASGLRLGILSNWRSSLPEVLHSTGLDTSCEAVLSSAAIGTAKPTAESFITMATTLGVEPADMRHIGDDPISDAAGALSSGAGALLVNGSIADPAVGKALKDLVT